MNTHHVGIVGKRRGSLVDEQRQFPTLGTPAGGALRVPAMKDGRTLPATLLIPRQLTKLRDDALPRPALRAMGFDQREVGVSLAVLGPVVFAKKHPCLPACNLALLLRMQGGRSSLHAFGARGLRLALSPKRFHPRNQLKNRYDSLRTAQPGLRQNDSERRGVTQFACP